MKDAIESCGVPHPEVDLIRCDGVPVSFDHALTTDAVVDVYGVGTADESRANRLQQRRVTQFVADGHLGKLVRDLRLLGFDVTYAPDSTDAALAAACSDERALLTRDRRLLMHKVIRHGYCPRSHVPEEQTIEVIRRFDLAGLIAPFTRCIQCNGPLVAANKADIFEQLEPLTKIYYQTFRRCSDCGKVYWSGSHFGKLEARIDRIRMQLNLAATPQAKTGPERI